MYLRNAGITREHEGFDVEFNDVVLTVDGTNILRGVSAAVKAGEVLAILGPSGAGKSTLLNALSQRIPIDSGSITINDERVTKRVKRRIGYVLQDDILFPELTLRDSLTFSAKLLMPNNVKDSDKLKRMHEIVDYLGLSDCMDTMIGGGLIPGLSGGEKKRANIATELLSNPSIILLDEPTSGLDAVIAANLISFLEKLAKDFNKTIITTVHQPSTEIYNTFDNVLFIHEGMNAYFGPSKELLPYLEQLGQSCPPHYNPADFMLEKVKETELFAETIVAAAQTQRHALTWSKWPKVGKMKNDIKRKVNRIGPLNHNSNTVNGDIQIGIDTGNGIQDINSIADESYGEKRHASFGKQLGILFQRQFMLSSGRILSKVLQVQMCIVSTMIGFIWFQLPWTEANLHNRMGLYFFLTLYWGHRPASLTATTYPAERPVIKKEVASGAYKISGYYIAKMTTELLMFLFMATYVLTIIYLMTTRTPDLSSYLFMLCIIFLSIMVSQAFGTLIGTLGAGYELATVCTTTFITMSSLCGGFFIDRAWHGMTWVHEVSYVRYVLQSLISYDYINGRTLRCLPPEETAFEICRNPVGNNTHIPGSLVLEELGISVPIWKNVLALIAFSAFFRILGFVCIKVFNTYGVARQKYGRK